jgi:hypothetical protein
LVSQARALTRQHRGQGYVRFAPGKLGWLFPLAAAAAVQAAFPALGGWEQVERACSAAPVVSQGAGTPKPSAKAQASGAEALLVAQLEQVKRLYHLVFQRAPDEVSMRKHIQSEEDAAHWLMQLRKHQQHQEAARHSA